jgi:hypothetical protein
MELFPIGTRVIVNGQVDEIFVDNQVGTVVKSNELTDLMSRPLVRFDNKFNDRLHDGGFSGDWGNHWFCDPNKVSIYDDDYRINL